MDKLIDRNRMSVNDLLDAIKILPHYDVLHSIIRECASLHDSLNTRSFEWLQNIAKKDRDENPYSSYMIEILSLTFRFHNKVWCFRDPIKFSYWGSGHCEPWNYPKNSEETIQYSLVALGYTMQYIDQRLSERQPPSDPPRAPPRKRQSTSNFERFG